VVSSDVEVDAEKIRRGGGGIRSAAQQLRAEWEAFQGELSSHGEPWGQDMIGALIGGCYYAILEVAGECIEENLAGLEDHADGVNTMASTYFQAEDASKIEVNRVRDILG
jgi:hypothetical protein